jgi:aerobic-type carbon monoxide dehydrogenase small subunit (CoxS/CutS family)
MATTDMLDASEAAARAVSRRLFIKGVIAAGATVSTAAYLFRQGSVLGQQPSLPGGVERLITLNVNGQARRVDVMKQETLAMTLRYKLGLTGTKLGCDRAECGACTVLIDDVPHYSCSTLTHTVRGRKVTTIEGLAAADGTLHPLQEAFREHHGLQCGFCTPGMITRAWRLLQDNPRPSEAEIRVGISGNLCRCTGYQNIVKAIQAAAEKLNAMPEAAE